ncbi:Fe(3+) dicitrate transport protein [Chitinophaga costaii]|uniref:Fe(3+) dicitrate transport protein n=1 Tax=Chitinophaga costaii TaxID=1335309 RepID=A0A1C4EMX0_9BACT|nr:TonB-dependent receptor [Chitinophaga costaii]PUZ22455.1 TonB-dependent receptor [Chitinophaga costaii]SCC44907.1 Fe(3+) dicitrate transport protein [Chitinophaga costaii]
MKFNILISASLCACAVAAFGQDTTHIRNLDSVIVRRNEGKAGFSHLHDVEGTSIYAGKKTEVIVLKDVVANTATNNPRQVYGKVAGLNIWENDGAGIQLAIGGRGLSPNRVANFNTRQNGYDISADALGYPESYYTPPVELMDRIEIVRGAASLQYGTQFGGMINFKLHEGPTDKKFSLTERATAGSWGFFNSSTSIGGTVKKWNYYAFYQHKSGNGWRPNAEFNTNTAYGSLTYKANEKLAVTFQYTFMDYLAHQPGGLTDADFAKDPHQSVRARNWFRVNWNLGAVMLDYKINSHLQFNTRFFGLMARRDALGILTFIDRVDNGETDRDLYKDHYQNWGNESRLLYNYNIGKVASTLLLGFRYYQGHTDREQGFGNNGTTGHGNDFSFTPALQTDTLRYSDYIFPERNTAVFAENIFRITSRFSIIPGVRFEHLVTKADGNYTNVAFDLAGNPIDPQKVMDNKINRRSFVIGGVGATYQVRNDIQVYANFSQNYKAINFNDLRTLNPNLRVDSALHDEKGYSADAGIRKTAGVLRFDVSLFMINYNNKIGSILSVDPQTSIIYNLRTNVSQSRHIGVESYVEADIWKWIAGDNAKTSVSIFSNFSYLSAKYVNSKEKVIEGRKVEFVPDIIFKTGLMVRRNKWTASYQFAYTGQQFTDATNAVFTANAIDGKIPAYHIMDLSAEYTFSKMISLYGSVNNLANTMYFTRRADSYPGPGIVPSDARSFYLTLQLKL